VSIGRGEGKSVDESVDTGMCRCECVDVSIDNRQCRDLHTTTDTESPSVNRVGDS